MYRTLAAAGAILLAATAIWWPTVASAAPAEGDASAFTYTGTWTGDATERISKVTGDIARVDFTIGSGGGTVSYIAFEGPDRGTARVGLDADTLGSPVNLYHSTRTKVTSWTSPTLAAGPHSMWVKVTGNKSSLSSSPTISVAGVSVSNGSIGSGTPPPTNAAPTVSAGAAQTVTLPDGATLDGTVSDDGLPTGSTLTQTWSKLSGPGTVTFADAGAVDTTATFSAAGTYTLRLTATDGSLTGSADVVVTVNAAPVSSNAAPTVDAGPDQAVTLPSGGTLSGTVSDDGQPAGSTVTQTWSKVSGPGTVTFADPSAASTTATFSVDGTYTLRLTASDGALSTSDDVVVTVSPATPPPPPPSTGRQYPADSGVVNLATAYGAVSGTDITAELNQAYADYAWIDSQGSHKQVDRGAPITLYLPAGDYRLSGSVISPGSSVRFAGAGEGLTNLRLVDNAPGFGSVTNPKYVLKSGNALSSDLANSGFSNYFRDFTLTIGAGNPGAVALRPDMANTGAVERVTLDGRLSGYVGVSLETSVGPAIIRDLTVLGFDWAVDADQYMVNDVVFVNTVADSQRQGVVRNDSKPLFFDGLTSRNNAVVVKHLTANAATVVVDATLTGTQAGTNPFQANGGFLYQRNVTADVATWSRVETATHNWQQGNVENKAWDGAVHSANLPKVLAPAPPVVPLSAWANVKDFSPGADIGPAIQRAVDSGARVVYLPYGSYTISSDVVLRGNVERLDLVGSNVSLNGGRLINRATHTVWIEDGALDDVVMQDGPAALVLRNLSNGGSGLNVETGTGATGDLFVENVGANATMTITQPIRVFAWQFDREHMGSSISGGAKARVFGDNVELHSGTCDYVALGAGTVLELFGEWDALGYTNIYPASGAAAAFSASGGARLSLVVSADLRDSSVGHWVHDGSVGDVFAADAVTYPARGSDKRVLVPLYVTP